MTARKAIDRRLRSSAGRRSRGPAGRRVRRAAAGRPWIVGVLGGMGPLATGDFYTKLVRLTPAARDQDHLHVIIDSNPQIPDRTAAVLDGGPDPTPELVATARRLKRAGATLIAIPCNSAHAFLGAIRRAVGIPVLDIMDEVAAAAASLSPAPRAVGLLATSATLRMRLYHDAFDARGIAVLEPAPEEQQRVMAAVHAVKAGDLGPAVRAQVRDVAQALVRRGAQAIVLGCTELPLVAAPEDAPVPFLDGTEILARAAIRAAAACAPRAGGARGEFRAPSRRSLKSRKVYQAGSPAPVRRN